MSALPIRTKLALWAGIAMTFALGAFAIGTLFNLYRKQVHEADLNIRAEFNELEAFLPGRLPEEIDWQLDPFMGWTVFDENGRMLRKDPIISEEAARVALPKNGVVDSGPLTHWRRVESFHVGPNRTIVVGYDMARVFVILKDLVIAYAWSLPLVVVVVAIGSWWVTASALSPIKGLAGEIEGIRSDQLDRRVEVPPAVDEVQSLASSFNALLARLERSFAQAKRFATDASHEFRTPLTIVRSEVEQVIRHPALNAELLPSLVSVQDEIARLDRITEQLLALARFDAGHVVLAKTDVAFSELVADACNDAELIATGIDVELRLNISPNVRVSGDATHLRRLLLNLLDNACKYNRPHGKVHCTLVQQNGSAVLRIANNGSGIPQEMKAHVFERFFRADPSRATTSGHGLGLALCWEIVELHGGRITVADTAALDWTEFEVVLPST